MPKKKKTVAVGRVSRPSLLARGPLANRLTALRDLIASEWVFSPKEREEAVALIDHSIMSVAILDEVMKRLDKAVAALNGVIGDEG